MTAPVPTADDRRAATRFLQLACAAQVEGSFERLLIETIATARAEGFAAGLIEARRPQARS